MTNSIHCFEKAGLGKAPFTFVGFQVSKFQACPGAPIQCGTSCDYCGTGIMNVYTIESADGKLFKVGCDCVNKTGDAGLIGRVKAHRNSVARTIRAERKAARIAGQKRLWENAARMRRAAARKQAGEFAVAHGLVKAFKVALRGPSKAVAKDVLQKLRTMGNLTPNTVNFILDLAVKLSPAPVGRVEFSGVIKSAKIKESDFGAVCKMLVLADGGFKVWVSIPKAIEDKIRTYGRPLEKRDLETLRGKRVQLKATLKASNDPGLAYGSRPAGKLLEVPTAEQRQRTYIDAMNH